MKKMNPSRKDKLKGILLLLLSFSVVTVSAYVYQQATMTIDQTIVEVATITLKNSDLGNLKEGQSATYNKSTVANLGDAISLITQESNVYLHLDSNLDTMTTHSTYEVVVKAFTVPGGSAISSGDTVCTINIGSPDYSAVDLDVSGTWTFDLEISTSVGSVDNDVVTQATIIVSAESTS